MTQPPPLPTRPAVHLPNCALHESRLTKLEDIVGRPPFLDDPGSGIAKLAQNTHDTVLKAWFWGKWAVLVMAGALLTQAAMAVSSHVNWVPQARAASTPSQSLDARR